jgi:hypothetical protein
MIQKEFINEEDNDHEYLVHILESLERIREGLCSDNDKDERLAFINLGVVLSLLRVNLQEREDEEKQE